MEPNKTKIDANGKQVLSFMSKINNLGRIGDLTKAVVEMAESKVWRDYTTGLGREQWRPAEFDYFLIAQGVRHDDARKVISWNEKGAELAPLMDPQANGRSRRPIERAAETWHSPGFESFMDRAKKLEWIADDGKTIKPAVSERARRTAIDGLTNEEHARRSAAHRIPAKRRRELDGFVDDILKQFESVDERRYILDQLCRSTGRPRTSAKMLAAWRKEAERLEWKATALAELWGVSRQQAHRRINQLRQAPPVT